MATLQTVLPVYCSVLLQDAYKDYLAEIIIVGYTDTQGDYSYNLELSQRRSLAVAQYLLEIQGNFLTAEQSADLQEFLTVNGQSMSNPVLDADGNVDDDASRRVEVKFRLKDDEMMEELNSILSDLNTEETTDAAAAETADTDTAAEEAADTAAGETEETASEG
ncbi:MAG: OmpA family protein [Clostridiales bacterium]|nr:OmpA family protein [Clostridiales bacterium]